MQKKQCLVLSLLIGLGSLQLHAHDDIHNCYGYLHIAKAVAQLSTFFYLTKTFTHLDEQKEVTRSCRYKHGFEKWWLFLGGGLLAASFTDDCIDNMKRVGLFAGLVGATHAIANNSKVIRSTRRLPFAGSLLTDPEDEAGFEQTSVGAIARYASTYMALRTLTKWLTEDTECDASQLLV